MRTLLQNLQIKERLYATLTDFIDSWGLDAEITADTRLVADLEFDSIDVIQLTVAFEKAFNTRKLGFQDLLMQDGRYVDDLTVGQIEGFLERRLTPA